MKLGGAVGGPLAKTIFRSFRPTASETTPKAVQAIALSKPAETTPEPTGRLLDEAPDAIGIMPDVVVLLLVIGMTICLAPRTAWRVFVHDPLLSHSISIPLKKPQKYQKTVAGTLITVPLRTIDVATTLTVLLPDITFAKPFGQGGVAPPVDFQTVAITTTRVIQGLRTTFSCVFEGFSRELSSNHIINTNCNALYSPIIYRKVATV